MAELTNEEYISKIKGGIYGLLRKAKLVLLLIDFILLQCYNSDVEKLTRSIYNIRNIG